MATGCRRHLLRTHTFSEGQHHCNPLLTYVYIFALCVLRAREFGVIRTHISKKSRISVCFSFPWHDGRNNEDIFRVFQLDAPVVSVTLDPAWQGQTVQLRVMEMQLYPHCRTLRANYVEFTNEDWAEISRLCPNIEEIYNRYGSPMKAGDLTILAMRFRNLKKIRFLRHVRWFEEKPVWKGLLRAYEEVDFGYTTSDFDEDA